MKVQLVPRHGDMPKVKLLEKRILEACPLPVAEVARPTFTPDVLLVMYGAGSPEKTAMMQYHRSIGGRVVCFDRGYFGRSPAPELEHYRVAIDELHAKPEHIHATPDDPVRFRRYGISLREDYNSEGPVIVVGLGRKSRSGLKLFTWEQDHLRKAKSRFPLRRIVYRPKGLGIGRAGDGVRWPYTNRNPSIEEVLKGASLVITRHSNVAVDACIAGIPVELEDGAARWLYSTTSTPSADRRISFLNRLAWWNWRANEMEDTWKFLLKLLH